MASPMAMLSPYNYSYRGANLSKLIHPAFRSTRSTSTSRFLQIYPNFGGLKTPSAIRERSFVYPTRLFSSKGDSGGKEDNNQENELNWSILRRWDVPWPWQAVSLTSLACGISFVLTGLLENAAIPYFGIQIGELTMDQKAEFILLGQSFTTAAVLGVLFTLTSSFRPVQDDIFRYDLKDPFSLQKGWLLWAGFGLIGAIGAIALTGVALSYFVESPEREMDSLVTLLPLIGASPVSTACLIGITGILAPILEETVFRGFFMVSLTQWVPTPVAIGISAAVFALAHLQPGEFPQLFVLGIALGISYAQTRNLLTSITIHSVWNSGVIMILTFLQLQGYDIRELIQGQ